MDVCNDCQKAKDILSCVTDLVVGTLSPATTYDVYLQNNTTGRLVVYESVTTDGAGLLTLTGVASEFALMPKHSYSIWAILETAEDIEAMESITVDGNPYDCLTFMVRKAQMPDGIVVTASTQRLRADV